MDGEARDIPTSVEVILYNNELISYFQDMRCDITQSSFACFRDVEDNVLWRRI